MLDQLEKLVATTNPRSLGLVLKTKHSELYSWVLAETSNSNFSTLVERIHYLLLDKPELECEHGGMKKFSTRTKQFSYCGNTRDCQCFREYVKDMPRNTDQAKATAARKKTWLEKHGVENISQLPEVKHRRRETMRNRDYSELHASAREKKQRAGFSQVVSRVSEQVTPEFTEAEYHGCFRKNQYLWSCNTCGREFLDHVDYGRVPRCTVCNPYRISAGELSLRQYIEGLGVQVQSGDRTLLKSMELDLLLPEHNLAIEFNGIYWHSSRFKDRFYHYDKFAECRRHGVHLIQIFEDEWINKPDIIKSRISSLLGKSPRLYARKLKIGQVSQYDYREFCELHHLQGHATASFVTGLWDQERLVAVMSFSKSRYAESEYELVRFCTEGTIVGAASRLFAYFVRVHNPSSVVSYANRCWSQGNLYRQLGFKDTTPVDRNVGYWYVKNFQRWHRSNFTKKRLVQQGHDCALSESEIMENLGYLKIYDCGNYRFTWTREN